MAGASVSNRKQRHGLAARVRTPLTILPLVAAASIAALLGQGLVGFVQGPGRAGAAQLGRPQREQSLRRLLRVAAPVALKVEFGASDADAIADAKAKLLDLLSDAAVEEEVLKPDGKPTRGRVDEAIIGLERLNPTEEPVYSDLLDGEWFVKYAGSYAPGLLSSPTRELALFLYGGGFSLGNVLNSFGSGFWGQSLGVKVGTKKVRIQGGRDVDATADIELAGREDKLSYTAELMPLSPRRMSEEIVSVELPPPVGTQDLPLELRRSILVTYLDEELLVVRDESGVPEVLMREVGPQLVPGALAPEPATEPLVEPAATAAEGNMTDASAENPTASD